MMDRDAPRVRAAKRIEVIEDVHPVVLAVLAGVAAEEDQLRLPRVVDVDREVDQARARKPEEHGGGERVAGLEEQEDADPEEESHLEDAAAGDVQELAEEHEEDM